jgi:hypothetical protein
MLAAPQLSLAPRQSRELKSWHELHLSQLLYVTLSQPLEKLGDSELLLVEFTNAHLQIQLEVQLQRGQARPTTTQSPNAYQVQYGVILAGFGTGGQDHSPTLGTYRTGLPFRKRA